jgi:hypothetical protein
MQTCSFHTFLVVLLSVVILCVVDTELILVMI